MWEENMGVITGWDVKVEESLREAFEGNRVQYRPFDTAFTAVSGIHEVLQTAAQAGRTNEYLPEVISRSGEGLCSVHNHHRLTTVVIDMVDTESMLTITKVHDLFKEFEPVRRNLVLIQQFRGLQREGCESYRLPEDLIEFDIMPRILLSEHQITISGRRVITIPALNSRYLVDGSAKYRMRQNQIAGQESLRIRAENTIPEPEINCTKFAKPSLEDVYSSANSYGIRQAAEAIFDGQHIPNSLTLVTNTNACT